MAYTFTEKKRIRKNFGKRQGILDVPPLLAIQTDSYAQFLQLAESRALHAELSAHAGGQVAGGRLLSEEQEKAIIDRHLKQGRPARGVPERVPDQELLGPRDARVRLLLPRRAGVRRQGMPDARAHLCRATARPAAPARHGQGVAGRLAREARDRAGGLSRRAAAHDRERHLHRQRHRARDRVPAAPQPGRDLRPRQGQDPQLREAAVPGARDSRTAAPGSTSSSTRRTACSRASTAAGSFRSRSCCARSAIRIPTSCGCSSTAIRCT